MIRIAHHGRVAEYDARRRRIARSRRRPKPLADAEDDTAVGFSAHHLNGDRPGSLIRIVERRRAIVLIDVVKHERPAAARVHLIHAVGLIAARGAIARVSVGIDEHLRRSGYESHACCSTSSLAFVTGETDNDRLRASIRAGLLLPPSPRP